CRAEDPPPTPSRKREGGSNCCVFFVRRSRHYNVSDAEALLPVKENIKVESPPVYGRGEMPAAWARWHCHHIFDAEALLPVTENIKVGFPLAFTGGGQGEGLLVETRTDVTKTSPTRQAY